MADNKQFGTPQQFGDKPGKQPGDDGHCAECEAMLADALDGTLSPADQTLFDTHMAHCGPCSQMLADARRGAAWLEMLRDPRPEPPAELLEKILSQTSGTQHLGIHLQELPIVPAPAYATPDAPSTYGNVLPFRSRFASAARASSFMLHPRFIMTAAMAFFSIALTLSLTGVRLQDLRASDFRPSSIQRDFSSANARVVRYYEGLRVVYELESRVHDLESTSDTDVPAGTQTTTQPSPASSPDADQPADQTPAQAPAAEPGPTDQKTTPPPAHSQPEQKRPAPNPGTSRREDFNQTRHLVALNSKSFRKPGHARVERTLA